MYLCHDRIRIKFVETILIIIFFQVEEKWNVQDGNKHIAKNQKKDKGSRVNIKQWFCFIDVVVQK